MAKFRGGSPAHAAGTCEEARHADIRQAQVAPAFRSKGVTGSNEWKRSLDAPVGDVPDCAESPFPSSGLLRRETVFRR